MSFRIVSSAVGFGILIFLSSASEAQQKSGKDWRSPQVIACDTPGLPDQFNDKVNKCIMAIDSGREQPEAVAFIYYTLGSMYYYRFKNAKRKHGNLNDLDVAIDCYTKAIALFPDKSTYTYILRAEVFLAKGEFDRAISDYSEAIRQEPEEHEFYQKRGDAQRAKGDFDRAIADYSEQIRIVSFFLDAYKNRGVSYFL
jgi:tetratricopeptide (TPR) repeat protein